MKKLFTILLAVAVVLPLSAQKKPLDRDVYDIWQNVSSVKLTDDGNYIFYVVQPGQGDGNLIVRSLSDGREISVPRGQNPTLSADCSWALFSIKPTFAQTRKAKIQKKKEMPKDTLAYMDLKSMEIVKIPKVNSFKCAERADFTFAYETGKKDSSLLVVVRPGTLCDTIKGAKSYYFDNMGKRLVVAFKDSLSLYLLPSMERRTLSSGKKFYSKPSFNTSGDKIAFLASTDSTKSGNKHCSVFLYNETRAETRSGKSKYVVTYGYVSEIIPQNYKEGLPEGFCVTENADPYFSSLSNRLFIGISKFIPENDTTIYSFETASLDIWNADKYMTPPIQKVGLERLKKQTLLCVVSLSGSSHKIVQLAKNETERVSLIDGGEGEYAVVMDNGPYQIDASWDSNSKTDVSLVELSDGSRTQLFKGLDARVSVSPKGKYLLWYSGADTSWFSYRLSDGRTTNLTAGVDGIFYDDEDDHPSHKPSIGRPNWSDDDKWFLLDEKFSIFKIQPDGEYAVDLTKGAAKRDSVKYRYQQLVRDTISPILARTGIHGTVPQKGMVYLTTFDVNSREAGFATMDISKPGIKTSFTQPKSFLTPTKALNSSVIAYKKGDFRNSPDVYVTNDLWNTEQQLSHINPQQKDYYWGNISLVSWKAYDGTPLDGLLIFPENLDTTASYPMIVYFYERYSDELYNYRRPAPSASTVNWSEFASRGYVVFVPDIKYVDGHPGECAFNCVCSGCEAMCQRYPFIDSKRMGIQGQSWGGYQTAYLVTRTNMFAAAGAGAPVGNMTSAYGGIRWGSGVVRAMQYEHGQSRIGKSLWDEGGLELYIENSPIFHTQNVTTPVLIMHNDADGAVPWYQGIEFFMALRRFHHPAWLLQYNGEEHNLVQWRNKVDLSRRLQQFFDHYLKGEPMPAWMRDGVPMVRKGQYFGFEQ